VTRTVPSSTVQSNAKTYTVTSAASSDKENENSVLKDNDKLKKENRYAIICTDFSLQ